MENRLRYFENEFKKGSLKKDKYINKMHDLHVLLWNYLDFIKDKNVDSIKITEEHIVLKTRSGIKMICDPEDERSIPIEILNFGDYESSEIRMMHRFLKVDSILLDIGANIGWCSLNLSRAVPKGRILAFEPIPKTYDYLKRNIEINGVKNIEKYNFGFSEKKGNYILYYNPKLSVATSLQRLYDDKEVVPIKCKLKKLDDFAKEKGLSKIDFIKCDIEGAEILAIKGGLETIEKTHPVIFLEMLRKWSAKFGYHPNDIIKILSDIDYKCYFIKNMRLVEIKEVKEDTISTNFYFLHPKKHATILKIYKI